MALLTHLLSLSSVSKCLPFIFMQLRMGYAKVVAKFAKEQNGIFVFKVYIS